MEMKQFNYMLKIDILKKSSQKYLGVLRGGFWGFGCQKDTQMSCWLRLCCPIKHGRCNHPQIAPRKTHGCNINEGHEGKAKRHSKNQPIGTNELYYIEMKIFNCMLEIDILSNSSQGWNINEGHEGRAKHIEEINLLARVNPGSNIIVGLATCPWQVNLRQKARTLYNPLYKETWLFFTQKIRYHDFFKVVGW